LGTLARAKVDAVKTVDVMDKAAGTSHLSCKLLILKVH